MSASLVRPMMRSWASVDNAFQPVMSCRYFCPVDKADQVAVIEITKAMHFVDRRNGVADPGHDLGRQFETEIHALGANVKDEIAGCRHGMARAGLDFPKGMQFRRPRLPKEPVPCVGSNPHHAGKVA